MANVLFIIPGGDADPAKASARHQCSVLYRQDLRPLQAVPEDRSLQTGWFLHFRFGSAEFYRSNDTLILVLHLV